MKSLDESIIELVDEEEILKEIETAANFTERIKEIVIDIEEKLKLNDQQENEKTAANSSSAVATSKSTKLAYARLPKLVIKKLGAKPVTGLSSGIHLYLQFTIMKTCLT